MLWHSHNERVKNRLKSGALMQAQQRAPPRLGRSGAAGALQSCCGMAGPEDLRIPLTLGMAQDVPLGRWLQSSHHHMKGLPAPLTERMDGKV